MPHSFVFGHLPVIAKLMSSLPRDLHPNYIPQLVVENFRTLFPDRTSCPGALYVDMWPMGPPMLFTINPDLTNQLLQEQSLRKAENAIKFLYPLAHNLDLVSSDGARWKIWRSRLSPGFSAKNITALIPAVLGDVAIFRDQLRAKAGENGAWGDVFALEDMATNLTLDVIGRAALDVSLREQTKGPSALKTALLDQLTLCMFDYNILTLPKMISPVRHWKMARNTRKMRDFLLPAVQRRIGGAVEKSSHQLKTVVDLTVKAFNEEVADKGEEEALPDREFVDTVIAQLKIFVFAGHDTTATTICWVLHCLAKTPKWQRGCASSTNLSSGRTLPPPRSCCAARRTSSISSRTRSPSSRRPCASSLP